MRVTILTDRYTPEARAAAYLSTELAEGLAGLGHEVSVITRMPTHFVPGERQAAPKRVELAGGVRVRRVSGFTTSSKVWLRALDQFLVALKLAFHVCTGPSSDVLLVYSPPLLLPLAAVLQKCLRRRPFLLNLHDLYPQTAVDLGVLRNRALISLAGMIESVVYRAADKIIVAAPASKRILIEQKQVPADKVDMIFNYIDTKACAPGALENEFRRRIGAQGRFVVLYAGLMGLAQDLTSVIDAARQVEDDPDWVFILAGDGPQASKWAAMAKGLSNVRMVGPLDFQDYYQALRAADVCLVALSASFKAPAVPGKVPTIMAAGRPVVASVPLGNDTREILESAGAGFAVEPGRPEQLLAVLRTLKGDYALRDGLGANGRSYAAAHFEARTAVRRFEATLSQVTLAEAGRRTSEIRSKTDAREPSGIA